MTNNEKKSSDKWSLKKTILFIVLVILLFATMFSCGLNTFKTTYNQVNQVNYEEKYDLLTDYTSVNKINNSSRKNAIISNGTSVPNNSYVDTIYFNISFSTSDELINYFFSNGVTPDDFVTETNNISNVLFHSNTHTIIMVINIDSNFNPIEFSILDFDNTSSTTESISICRGNVGSNIVYINSSINVNSIGLTSFSFDNSIYYNVGNINSKINAFMSITPFNYNGGGGSYTPNPQYNIVQPSINGDLILGTLIEPDLQSQTTFSELYVSYIIGASDYTYTLNLVINLVLEGTNNYYNISVSNNLNINDLNNSSFTNIIANFDSDLEELNLIIEVYSNNSVIYTYNDSFSCVMNNSFTYPYQVSGFSNTQTAKQYVSSYNSTQAYNNGYNIGNREGYSSGYDVGYDEGYDLGYDEGYNFTDDKGHYRGYDQGYHDGSNNEFAKDGVKDLVNIIFNAPYNIFNGFLNFEIFGVNLFNLLSFIFTLVLVGWIIALLMKR